MVSFIETRFPTDISYGSVGGPEFVTDIIEVSSGHEQRNIRRSRARARYNVSYGIRTQQQLDRVRELHYAVRGRAIGFRFQDPLDHQSENELLGVGDGKRKDFAFVKHYTARGSTYQRRLHKIAHETVTVWVSGEKATAQKNAFTLDENKGVVTFKKPPKKNAKVTASFTFDVPVRFDSDYFPQRMDTHGATSVQDITLIEILL